MQSLAIREEINALEKEEQVNLWILSFCPLVIVHLKFAIIPEL